VDKTRIEHLSEAAAGGWILLENMQEMAAGCGSLGANPTSDHLVKKKM